MAQWLKHLPSSVKTASLALHTHKTPSPPQQQQKEHTGAFKNISALDSLTVCLFRFAYLLIADLLLSEKYCLDTVRTVSRRGAALVCHSDYFPNTSFLITTWIKQVVLKRNKLLKLMAK